METGSPWLAAPAQPRVPGDACHAPVALWVWSQGGWDRAEEALELPLLAELRLLSQYTSPSFAVNYSEPLTDIPDSARARH